MARIIVGDNVEAMRQMQSNSIDAIVTDPPAGISFMGKQWDSDKGHRDAWVSWMTGVMAECLRVAKPGAHALVWALPRTSGWTHRALEDAGWDVRDCIAHIFATGFPKSLDIGKSIDKHLGSVGGYGKPKSAAHAGWIERGRMRGEEGHEGYQRPWMNDAAAVDRNARDYLPATDAAKQWDGWGTALKPAVEFWYLARKPLAEKTVAANVLAYGTGALNIDATRIDYQSENDKASATPQGRATAKSGALAGGSQNGNERAEFDRPPLLGRWPANVAFDEAAARALDDMSGERGGGFGVRGKSPHGRTYANGKGFANTLNQTGQVVGYGDTGGASRFFFCAKASRSERNAGLEGMPERERGNVSQYMTGTKSNWIDDPRHPNGGYEMAPAKPNANDHPTVKPISLMQWLVRLVTPPAGTILDPFLGSGSTGVAAIREGFNFIGIEQDESYAAIASRRIEHAEQGGDVNAKGATRAEGGVYAGGKGRRSLPTCPEHGQPQGRGLSRDYQCGCRLVYTDYAQTHQDGPGRANATTPASLPLFAERAAD